MATPRLYVDMSLSSGAQITLPKGPAHHIATVLRRKTGDEVILFNGEGGEYHCALVQSDRKAVIVDIGEHNKMDRIPPLRVHLGMSILKKDPMDAVLSRITELGVSEITPVISDHCAVSLKMIRSRQAHWHGIVVSSCEQCGLNRLPALNPPVSIDEWVTSVVADRKLIALPGQRILEGEEDATDSVALIIGPEGGFSDRELVVTEDAGFEAVTFGERVLRAETAPAVALSVIHRTWGDF